MSDHLRMGGTFWALGALDVMGFLQSSQQEFQETKTQSLSCERPQCDEIRRISCEGTDGRIVEAQPVRSTGCSVDRTPPLHCQTNSAILAWISECWDPISGGYGPNKGHDAHITSTLVRLTGKQQVRNVFFPSMQY